MPEPIVPTARPRTGRLEARDEGRGGVLEGILDTHIGRLRRHWITLS
ncbi:hypothetical protein ACWT_5020 [Actinoplanes sp. SE50]|nr:MULTISPECIES: hypothetical protein [unclassified Actinoplanes]AEV86037.1 hypothetical protein ACPL_5150 [Actinoplanes sp. SE50/110]ATO84435.1 hypothetical protein ACWT_5020 [Actinoplanes sp. SE50]SLM01845.1 hypothetical protein ACSP50_5083 [Actinoplanes sp. SE50/110]